MKGRKINDTAIKARQIPDDHCVRAAFWTSMFQPQAPCFILKKMVWNPGEKDFYFSCPPGKDLILFIYCTKGECSITARATKVSSLYADRFFPSPVMGGLMTGTSRSVASSTIFLGRCICPELMIM